MSIQILQYEFLGPVSLDQWGPPMEKMVYLVLGRNGDSFRILYVGDCEKTDESGFFVNHPSFKCWINQSGSKKSLYLAILPLFDVASVQRKHVIEKIISHYKPACNDADVPKPPPYNIGTKKSDADKKIPCPCCGADLKAEKVLEKTTIMRCTECGISDTRLNS